MLEFWYLIRDKFLLKTWFTPLALVVGGIWALFLFRSSNKHERDNNELLNQPKFKFFDAMNSHCEIKRSCDTPDSAMRPLPDFCDNPDCNRIHWFDVKNDGNFPANDITISIALESEKDFRGKISERRMGVKHLQAQESLQFSTNLHSIPSTDYIDKKEDDNLRFYVFIQYKSGYSKYWYKRIYQIDATKIPRNNLPEMRSSKKYQDEAWARGVEFYGMSEQDCKCQKDVNIIQKVNALRKMKRPQTLEQYANNWVNDFLKLGLPGQLASHIQRSISRHK